MRKFTYPLWEYSIKTLEKLAARREQAWLPRFRIEYFFLLQYNSSPGRRLKQLIEGKLMFLALIKRLLQKQGGQTVRLSPDLHIIILLSNNNAYLNNILPVVHGLQVPEEKILLLCPANHYQQVKEKLRPELASRLFPHESVTLSQSHSGRILKIFSGWWQAYWASWGFVFSGIKGSFFFSAKFARYALTQRLYGKIIDNYFSRHRPILFASNDQWLWESLYFTIAQKHHINSYTLQHGAVGDYTFPIFARKFLLWGEYDRQKMIAETGATVENTQVAGSPYFDEVFKKINSLRTHALQREGKHIVFLTQPFFGTKLMEAEHYEQVKQWFYKLAPLAGELGKELVIQLHPRDSAAYYADRPESIRISNTPILEMLNESCLAVTVDSTAIFEAIMMEVPVIQLTVPGEKAYVDFSHSGASIWCLGGDQLLAAAEKLLNVPEKYSERVEEANKALQGYFYKLGNSIEEYRKLLE